MLTVLLLFSVYFPLVYWSKVGIDKIPFVLLLKSEELDETGGRGVIFETGLT